MPGGRAFHSGRLTGLQDSIDQPERLGKSIVRAKAHFAVSYGVDGRVDAVSELLELAGAEDEPPDGRLAAAEDEVVGAEERDLDLRLLDREQVLDRLRQRAVAVLEPRLELAQLVLGLGEREPAMDVDAQRLRTDVLLRDVRVDASVHPDRPRGHTPLSLQLRDRLVQQLDVELEADS